MKYNEQDMAKLISEVETEFKDYLTKAEQNEEVESTEVEAADADTLAKSEEFDYDETDISEMNEMYASMSKSEKEAHYSAIKQTLFTEEEASEDLNKSEEKVEEEVIAKSEVDSIKVDLKKSEEANEELKKNIETLTGIVSKIVKRAPARKAVTQVNGIEYIKKSEEKAETKEEKSVDFDSLSKKEINSILSGKIRNGEITKNEDKENINKFCYGQINLEKIKYLL
jgi:hypothetical protein